MKPRHLVCCSALALACGPAVDGTEPSENVGAERAELVQQGSTGVLVWTRDGEAALMVLRGNQHVATAKYRPGGTWRAIATADFDGDGHGDILWRDANNNGRLSLWKMFGGRMISYTENPTSPGWFSGWGTPLQADFDGNLVDDILWKGADGPTTVPVTERWTMQPGSAVPAEISTSRDPGWSVAGTGRFTQSMGDTTGLFWVSMDGYNTRFDIPGGGDPYAGPTVHPDWQVKGITDFDANGTDDILWRNRVTSDIGIWPISWGWPQSYPIVANVPGYHLVGTGDVDGDRVGELVWRGIANPDIAVTLLNPNYTVKALGPSIALDYDWKFVGVLKAPGKFGYGKLTVNKTRTKPNQCPAWNVTIRGTMGPQITRSIAPPGYPETCSYIVELADIQDTYTITYPGGCHKLTIMGSQKNEVAVAPADRCAPPPPPPMTPPPPPPPPPQSPQQVNSGALLTIWGGGPASWMGNIWYGGTFPPVPITSGSAVKITNPNGFLMGFPTAGNTTDDCNDTSKTILLGPGGALSSAQMAAIYGTSQPRLPIGIVACAAANPPPTTVLVTVTHVAQ